MISNIYQAIARQEDGEHKRLFTTIDEECPCEKLLLLGDDTVAYEGEGFLTSKLLELKDIKQSGLVEIYGRQVFVECIGSPKSLVICGGGHVSIPIVKMGKMLGFEVSVLEDRPLFANNARSAGADRVICESFTKGLEQIEGNPNTYFVVVTRGHRWDAECLRAILKKPYAYVGMMGSRKRVGLLKDRLALEGTDRGALDAVHTPIGLSIGAETPEEIAVSIMAEIIQVKNQTKKEVGYGKEMMEYLSGETETQGDMILTTIISKHGSAPRETGTKMLVLGDGRTIGTIGGGCMESRVIKESLHLLRNEKGKSKILYVDMTGQEAEEEGMVCGGCAQVFLEYIR